MGFDPNKLTLGESAFVEDFAKMSIASLSDESAPKSNLFIALAYVITRRTKPDFKISDAKLFTLEEIAEMLGDDDETAESRIDAGGTVPGELAAVSPLSAPTPPPTRSPAVEPQISPPSL